FFLAIYTCFVLFSQCGYSQIITIESDDIPYKYIYHLNITTNSVEECEYCNTTICRGSFCFQADKIFNLPFIEIPINSNFSQSNNNSMDCKKCNLSKTKRYILYPNVLYHDPAIDREVSTECSKNEQCFTNKCVNNTCVTNENADIKRCMFIGCGKFIGDPCTNNDECLDGECNEVCYIPDPPKEKDPIDDALLFLVMFGLLISIAIIGTCMGCRNSGNKSSKTESY
ncbi:hypothetical protein H8356DRAFT_950827, partial [Neocallimastix lanati (nom. inval.)]